MSTDVLIFKANFDDIVMKQLGAQEWVKIVLLGKNPWIDLLQEANNIVNVRSNDAVMMLMLLEGFLLLHAYLFFPLILEFKVKP